MRRQPTSSHQIWPIPAWVLTLGGLILLLFLVMCYILFWPRHPGASRGGPAQKQQQTAQLAPPSRLRQTNPAPQAEETKANPAAASPNSMLPAPPAQAIVPAATEIAIRTSTLIDSNADPVGSRFSGTVTSPIVVNGQIVVPQNSAVVLHLADKKKTGFFHRSLQIKVALAGISVNGRIYPTEANILNIKAGQNNGSDGDAGNENPAPKGQKALVILPNTPMTFTLTGPLTVISPTP